jgi:hypothetical protein
MNGIEIIKYLMILNFVKKGDFSVIKVDTKYREKTDFTNWNFRLKRSFFPGVEKLF